MNTLQAVPLSPGYVVEATNQFDVRHYRPRTFRNGHLRNARQAAFEHVRQLLTRKGDNEALAITIKLVEVDRRKITNATTVIDTIAQQPLTLIQPATSWNEVELTEVERAYYQQHGYQSEVASI